MADFGGDDINAFRAEARDWLQANFPASLKGRGGLMAMEGPASDRADFNAWTKAMGDKGWGVPTWPRAYGGGGLSAAQARALQQELNAACATSESANTRREAKRSDFSGSRSF